MKNGKIILSAVTVCLAVASVFAVKGSANKYTQGTLFTAPSNGKKVACQRSASINDCTAPRPLYTAGGTLVPTDVKIHAVGI